MRTRFSTRRARASSLVLLPLAALLTACPPQGVNPCLHQVNVDGFGDALNRYAWSMKVFGPNLYVGTLNTLDTTVAAQEGIPVTNPVSQIGETQGAEVWRYDGTTWSNVAIGGFGDVNNEGARNLEEFQGSLYAGTLNVMTGAEVWKSPDGVTWSQANSNGFGTVLNSSVRGMVSWRGLLWVGTINQRGGEIWQYDGTTWTKAASGGIDDSANDTIADMHVYQDQLFIGTWNDAGAQMYRYDGTTFTRVVGGPALTTAGFGDTNNTGIFSIVDFNGALYASTRNFITGFSVWRSLDQGATWSAVIQNGLGDARQRYGWRMHVHADQLYLGTFAMGYGGTDAAYQIGGQLFRTADGTNWVEEVGPLGTLAPPGIGDNLNYGIRTLETFLGDLHIGTAQCFFCDFPVTGAEVWRRDTATCPG